MPPQTLPLRSVAVAIIVGSLFGTAVGLWSIRGRPTTAAASVDADQIPMVEAVVAVPAPPASPPAAASPAPLPARTTQQPRDLVQRGDVRALLAIRERLVAQDNARGVEQIDRDLAEARVVRLKLDAEALRKSGSPAGNPPTQ